MSRRIRRIPLGADPFGISLRRARWWFELAKLYADLRAIHERCGEGTSEDIEEERRCRRIAHGYLWRRSLWRRGRAARRRSGGLVPWVHALARSTLRSLLVGRGVPRELGYHADVARKLCDRSGITSHNQLLEYIRALAVCPETASCFVDGPTLLAAAATSPMETP